MSGVRFQLSRRNRKRLLDSIAHKTGVALRVVARTSRTDAQIAAMERDAPYCQWHLRRPESPYPTPLHDIHHTRGRGLEGDRPEHCIALCSHCHRNVENALGNPTNEELIAILECHPRRLPILDYRLPIPSRGQVRRRIRPLRRQKP